MQIRWTQQDKDQIIRKAAELKAANPKISFVKLITEAQTVLPENRRRNINAVESVPWLVTGMAMIRMKDEDSGKAPEVPEVSEQTLPEEYEGNLFIQALANQLMKQLPDILIEKLGDKLKDELAEAVVTKLGERLLGGLVKPVVQEVVQPKPVEELKQPWVTPVQPQVTPVPTKVLIIGVSKKQEADLKEEFGAILDLTVLYEGEHSHHHIKKVVRSSGLILLVSNTISKSLRFSVDSAVEKGSTLKKIHGDVVKPREILEQYFCEKV